MRSPSRQQMNCLGRAAGAGRVVCWAMSSSEATVGAGLWIESWEAMFGPLGRGVGSHTCDQVGTHIGGFALPTCDCHHAV
jgi:hypothetical protein